MWKVWVSTWFDYAISWSTGCMPKFVEFSTDVRLGYVEKSKVWWNHLHLCDLIRFRSSVRTRKSNRRFKFAHRDVSRELGLTGGNLGSNFGIDLVGETCRDTLCSILHLSNQEEWRRNDSWIVHEVYLASCKVYSARHDIRSTRSWKCTEHTASKFPTRQDTLHVITGWASIRRTEVLS